MFKKKKKSFVLPGERQKIIFRTKNKYVLTGQLETIDGKQVFVYELDKNHKKFFDANDIEDWEYVNKSWTW